MLRERIVSSRNSGSWRNGADKMRLPKGTRLAIRQVLSNSCDPAETKRILKQTQTLYNAFIREAPAPGGMNILRPQYYGGLSVFAFL